MKPTKRTWIIAGATLFCLAAGGLAISDSDDHHEEDEHHDSEDGGWLSSRSDVAPVEFPLYAEECGACHMAYQPGLLPSSSWQRIMAADALADHYGDDASLGDDLRAQLTDYLTAHAADQAQRVRSRAFAVSKAGSAAASTGLPRITETAYFLRKHDDIPARLVSENPDVSSFSQCNKCHRQADSGNYHEDQVRIPGFGRWDD